MTAIHHAHRKTVLPPVRHTRVAVESPNAQTLGRVRHVPDASEEEDQEIAMLAKYCIGLAVIGITPLLVFLVMHYFFPDLLQFLGSPYE